MGSPWDPDGGQGRGAERDGLIPSMGPGGEPQGPGDTGVSIPSASVPSASGPRDAASFEEPDGGVPYTDVVPYNEDPGYVDETGGPAEGFVPAVPAAVSREAVVARQEERFGGIKIGAAFFGWFTATAMTVLLAVFVVAAGRAGLLPAADVAAGSGQTLSWPGGVTGAALLLMVPFLAYFSGGYVAGRMARFNGVGQGLMVWLWAVIVAAAVALVAMVSGIIGGGQFNVWSMLNEFLRLPVTEAPVSTSSIIAAIAVAALTLLGSVLGGMVGVHYHRKVDRVGFTPTGNYYHP